MLVLVFFTYHTFNLCLGTLFCHSRTWIVKANRLCPHAHNETTQLLPQECFLLSGLFQIGYLNYSAVPCGLVSLTISAVSS